jgi:hypothetical protein
MIAAGIVLAVVAVVVALHPATGPTRQPTDAATPSWSPTDADPLAYAQALVVDTNAARATAGFPPLSVCPSVHVVCPSVHVPQRPIARRRSPMAAS